MPAAFAAIRGVAEFLAGKTAGGVDGIAAPSDLEIEIRLRDPLPIFPVSPDRRANLDRRSRCRATDGRPGEAARHRALSDGSPHARTAPSSSATPAYWKEPPRLERIEFQRDALGRGDRRGPSLRRSSTWRGTFCRRISKPSCASPASARDSSRRPRRTRISRSSASGRRAGSNATLRLALASAARAQDFVWGALGRFALPATGLLPPGILGHDPGRRQPHVPREKAIEMIRSTGLSTADQAQGRRASDPAEPVRRPDAGALPDLGGSGRRGRSGDEDHAGFPRGLARARQPRSVARPLDRRLRRPGQLHVHALPLENRPPAHLLRLSGGRPDPRGSQGRSPPGGAREPLPQVRALACSIPRRSFPSSTTWTTGSGAPRSGACSSTAPRLTSTTPRSERPRRRKRRWPPKAGRRRNSARADRRPRAESRPALAGHRRAGGGLSPDLPDADLRGRRDADRPMARGELLDRERRNALSVQAPAGRAVPRWAASDRARRPLLLRAAPREPAQRLPLAALADPRSPAAARTAPRLTDLEGFHIVSPMEFFIDLDQPVSFFPALISYIGSGDRPGRDGGGRLELARQRGRNGPLPGRRLRARPPARARAQPPLLARRLSPKRRTSSSGSAFHPKRSARTSRPAGSPLALDLLPADAEVLRHDPRFASGYREGPKLQSYFVVFNTQARADAGPELRRSLVRAVDAPASCGEPSGGWRSRRTG